MLKGRRMQVACGDHVTVSKIDGGAVIEGVAPRTTLVYRSDAYKEKLIAANATQIAGVVAPDIAVDESLLNRWIVAAEAEHCRFVVVANKSDLPGFDALRTRLQPYAKMGYPVVELQAKRNIAPLVPLLARQRTVLIGQSGMGKSTLINALLPLAAARVGDVSSALLSGRHTTSSSTLYPLPPDNDSWIVDSPGMKAFGLAHVAPDALAEAFVDLRPYLGHCRFRDCRHDSEPECAVRAAVDDGRVARQRLALLHALVRESTAARDPAR